jgi:predicted glycogen debranching enzyme
MPVITKRKMFTKDKSTLSNYQDAIQNEWLETNGLGGWSGSTIIGANTRRYHGLLVASIVPPVERMVLLSKLDEAILIGDKRIELGTNQYKGEVVRPSGHNHISGFERHFFPQWLFEVEGIQLRKTIAMIHGENTVVITYQLLEAPDTISLEFLPLIAARGYHTLNHAGQQINWDAEFGSGTLHCVPDGKTDLFINIPGSFYHHDPHWFYNFQYPVERYRGLEDSEDLLNSGLFTVSLNPGDLLGIIISTENPEGRNADELLEKEEQRRKALIMHQSGNEVLQQLVLGADQFIVERNITLKDKEEEIINAASIIAGYHWFTDWGRDTMIALPGICLSTGRFEDAKKILSAFSHNVSKGMLPNRFLDNGEETEYNTVDATLWYFIAIHKYLEATNDRHFILQEILPVLKEIIDWHFKGTRYNIKVDEDGLLSAGEKGQQLTWMDAKIGDWVVTPRMGKPVEVQALWYNALKIFSYLLEWNNQQQDGWLVNLSAEKARKSFLAKFWFPEGNYFYDLIDGNAIPDPTLRPNQLFAISLPYPLANDEQARTILKITKEKLYTPVGLRTLPQDSPGYVDEYGGDAYRRDASYHQGTVWSWLLGPLVDALSRYGDEIMKPQEVIDNFIYHLNEACIGSVSEIFDADPPYHPRGCVAQAWGVAEILRVIKAYGLNAIGTQKQSEELYPA